MSRPSSVLIVLGFQSVASDNASTTWLAVSGCRAHNTRMTCHSASEILGSSVIYVPFAYRCKHTKYYTCNRNCPNGF